jgi:tRNA pseudouridine65 synthase
MSISILYQDGDLVIVNKPSGLLVHRSAIDRYETQFAMQLVRDMIGQSVYTVHRLDKPTSGALVFALSPEIAKGMAEAFELGRVAKTYLAVVRGYAPGPVTVDHPLVEEPDAKMGEDIDRIKPAQSAVTEVECLAQGELPIAVDRYPTARYSLVKAQPRTGRRHQIRRHLRHLGNPIIGDITYGVGRHNRFFESHFGIRRLLLAATQIEFAHPRSGANICVDAPLAAEFSGLMEKFGWGEHIV